MKIALKYQFLKVTKQCNLTCKFETSVSIVRKKLVQFLPKLVKNLFHWMIFLTSQISVLAFTYVPMTSKRQQGSGKFPIWKIFIVKWRSFHFSNKFKKSLLCLYLKDISFYMFQNISCAKLILIHEKMPDIMTNRSWY